MLAIVCHAWNDDLTGGAFKVATDYARWVAGQGREVHYLCGVDPAKFRERDGKAAQQVDGVHIWRYPYPSRGGPLGLAMHVMRTRRLFQWVQTRHPLRVVNGHSPLQYFAVAAARRGEVFSSRTAGPQGLLEALASEADSPESGVNDRRKLQSSVGGGLRKVYSVHSPFADEMRAQGRAGWTARRMAHLIDGRCLRSSDGISTDSAYTLRRLESCYPELTGAATKVTPLWVDVERFRPVPDRAAVRRRLGAPWNPNVATFLSVRRLEPRMGMANLVAAARRLVDQGYEFNLLIGGSGSLFETLQQQIRELSLGDYVSLLGRVPDQDLADSYAAADCFVLPTKALECFGLIILESYACGVPVIATPVAAIPEIVTLAGDSWLAETPEPNALADRMAKFLRGHDGVNGRDVDDALVADPDQLREIACGYQLDARAAALDQFVMGEEAAYR